MHIMITQRRRTAVAAALVAVAIAVPTVRAQAAAPLRAQTGAGVLSRYLQGDDWHFYVNDGEDEVPDYGLTLDGVIALDASGVGDQASAKAAQFVGKHIGEYIGDGDTDSYAGATAKALLVSLSQKVSPKGTLGGVNLVRRLRHLETSSGRFSDKSRYGDHSNVVGQSYALIALHKDGKRLSYDSIAFLRQQQCSNGGFRLNPGTSPCKADPDATSFAVEGLLAAPQTHYTKGRIKEAIGYLEGRMTRSGGVHRGSASEAPNSNSTGLAVMAFDSTGHKSLAAKGRKFLISMRYGCAFNAGFRGAIAYNAERHHWMKTTGVPVLSDQDLRATTQALLGFAGKQLTDVTNTGAKNTPPSVRC